MLEVTIWSLLVGNLGWQAVVVSGWLRWRQIVTGRQHQEEEEILTSFESRDTFASAGVPQRNGRLDPHNRPSTAYTNPHAVSSESALAGPPQHNGMVDLSRNSSEAPTDPHLVGWEFKIVRASRDLFRDPALLHKLCQEEAMAGWILLEKLDDRRVRFKRLIALRNILDTRHLVFDPYRCHYGPSFSPLTWVAAIAALMAMVIPSYLGYALVSQLLTHAQDSPPSPYESIPPQDFPPEQEDLNQGG